MRRLFKNMGWLLGGRGFNAVLSLVYLALATRTLGLDGFGQFAIIVALGQMVTGLANFQTWQFVVRWGSGDEGPGEATGFAIALDSAIGCLGHSGGGDPGMDCAIVATFAERAFVGRLRFLCHIAPIHSHHADRASPAAFPICQGHRCRGCSTGNSRWRRNPGMVDDADRHRVHHGLGSGRGGCCRDPVDRCGQAGEDRSVAGEFARNPSRPSRRLALCLVDEYEW